MLTKAHFLLFLEKTLVSCISTIILIYHISEKNQALITPYFCEDPGMLKLQMHFMQISDMENKEEYE